MHLARVRAMIGLFAFLSILHCNIAPGAQASDLPRAKQEAASTRLEGKSRKVIDVVRDEGADPTGNVDSAPAFRAAMGSDRIVLVPPGIYLMASTQIPPCCAFDNTAVLVQGISNFEISGYGATVVIAHSIAFSSAFHFDRDSNFRVRGLTVRGNREELSASQENAAFALSSDVNFALQDLHITGNFGGNGTGIAGDWLVNGLVSDIALDAVGQCFDAAFLKNVRLQNLRARGADTTGAFGSGHVGSKCISVINDIPNSGTNHTNVAFQSTDQVSIRGVKATNFGTGAYLASGTHYLFNGNHWYNNPGAPGSHGIGLLVSYRNGGVATSVGVPVGQVTIDGDTFSNNGLGSSGWGILLDSSSIANGDQIRGIRVTNCIFDNNSGVGIGATKSAHLADIVVNGNTFKGPNQTTAMGAALAVFTAGRRP